MGPHLSALLSTVLGFLCTGPRTSVEPWNDMQIWGGGLSSEDTAVRTATEVHGGQVPTAADCSQGHLPGGCVSTVACLSPWVPPPRLSTRGCSPPGCTPTHSALCREGHLPVPRLRHRMNPHASDVQRGVCLRHLRTDAVRFHRGPFRSGQLRFSVKHSSCVSGMLHVFYAMLS